VGVETLNLAGLGRSNLATSIHDAAWGQFTAMLA
jgi:transposase